MVVSSLVVSLLQLAEKAITQAPLANAVLPKLADAERLAVRTLRAHLAELDPPRKDPTVGPVHEQPASPTDVLHSLLDRSMYNTPETSRNTLYLGLLQDLVPDEARILAALSDGSAYPVIDVAEPTIGTSTAIVLANASTVGRAAGVSLPQHTPLYLSRLILAGLAAIGPEGDNKMYDEYEMLLTDAAVNLALAQARRGVRSARVIRRTVRITALGQEMWDAAK